MSGSHFSYVGLDEADHRRGRRVIATLAQKPDAGQPGEAEKRGDAQRNNCRLPGPHRRQRGKKQRHEAEAIWTPERRSQTNGRVCPDIGGQYPGKAGEDVPAHHLGPREQKR